MKYSILGFNQQKVIEYIVIDDDGKELRCDLTDLMLLNYIMYANGTNGMKHIVKDENCYVWLNHKHIIEDLPILHITKGTLANRLLKLKKMDLIDSIQVANGTRGSRTYYSTTSFLNDLIYGNTSLKNDVIEESHHSRMTSDSSQLSNDKKVEGNLSKDKLDHSVPKNNLFLSTTTNKKQDKKPNLYEKCVSLIDDYTQDEKLHKALIDFLQVRLQNKEKPLYSAKMFKALLNKLDREFSVDERLDTVYQSTERGYASFFSVASNNNVRANKNTNIRKIEGIPHDGRYDHEDHTPSGLFF